MKRVKLASSKVWLTRSEATSAGPRKMFEPTHLTMRVGTIKSSCLGCPDQPCMTFSSAEVSKSTRPGGTFSPEAAVCPSEAMHRDANEVVVINEGRCIGCGLCVVRCPVGAIHLEAETAVAKVSHPAESDYRRTSIDASDFLGHREAISRLVATELAPLRDADSVFWSFRRLFRITSGQLGQKPLRLLARNTFLVSGLAAQLNNVGDSSSVSELLVDDYERLLVVEVESGVDTTDTVRRAVSSCAVAVSRSTIPLAKVSPAVVVPKLPNARVELYRLVGEFERQLGLKTLVIPVSLLLMAVRMSSSDLLQVLTIVCGSSGDIDIDEARRIFGDFGNPDLIGLVAQK